MLNDASMIVAAGGPLIDFDFTVFIQLVLFVTTALLATKFLFNVLPRDHPVLTGVLAAQSQLTEDWRKERGLDRWAAEALPVTASPPDVCPSLSGLQDKT